MLSLPAELGFLLWVVLSLAASGVAPLCYLTALRGIQLVGYGFGLGVLLHGLAGLAIALFPAVRFLFVLILFGFTLLSLVYLIRVRIWRSFAVTLSRPVKVSLALWFLLLIICLGILHLDLPYEEPWPQGGLLISQEQTMNVKVQILTGLPADNYIPFAVTEYFARGVSFKKERPIMPGNEVSNRTILMSLVALPFRVACGAPRDHPPLGTYNYIGRSWPNVWALNTGTYFAQFEIVGLVLNSLLLIGLLVFFSALGAELILPAGTSLYITNPYFLSQTLFTWPKPLAGFFILLAWVSLRQLHGPVAVGLLMALAYHCHPYAIVFAGLVGLFYLTHERKQTGLRPAILYATAFGVGVAPWFLWTTFVLHISSDLVAQNLTGPGTAAALASPINFIWVRAQNLVTLMTPMMFGVYPFDLTAVIHRWLFCLPGAVGVVLVYPGLVQCFAERNWRSWLWYGLLGPALALVAVFSVPALPILHGYQVLVGSLLFAGVWFLSRKLSRALYFWMLVGLQLGLNFFVVFARALIVGAHFP